MFKGKKILVVGMGLSGLASARYLQSKGSIVTISEERPRQELESELKSLKVQGINYEVGGHQVETFLETDCIVVSPGVPLNLFPIKKALNQYQQKSFFVCLSECVCSLSVHLPHW